MTALARTRRRRTVVMLAVNLAALLALGGIGYAGLTALRNYEGARDLTEPVRPLTKTMVGMLAVTDEDDSLAGIAVMVLNSDAQGQRGGSIVPIPVSADTALGVDGLRVPLTQVYAEGGAESLVTGVESVLSITLDHWAVLGPDDAAPLFAPIAPFEVNLPYDVADGGADDPDVVWPAGPTGLSAEQFVQLLTARVDGAPDRERRANIEAGWAGLAAAVGAGRTVVPDPAVPTGTEQVPPVVSSFGDVVQRLFAGPVAARPVAAEPLAPGEAPDGVDVEVLDFADSVMVFGAVAPSAMSASRDALVYRIEAPPGYDAQVRWAVTLVLYFGFNVQSVYIGADVPVQPATEIVLYDSASQEQVAAANDLFGEYVVSSPGWGERIQGVEVVLRLGTSFLEGVDGSTDTLPSTTTSTTIG